MNMTASVTVLMGCSHTKLSDSIDHLLKTENDGSLAAIVPKTIGRWRRKKQNNSVIRTAERFVRLGQGCSCCTVRSDLLVKVKRLIEKNPVKHLLIHTFPKTDLIPLAKTFTVPNEDNFVLSEIASLTNMTLIINASQILKTLYSKTARQLIAQIEYANKLILTHTSTLPQETTSHIRTLLEILNPQADFLSLDIDTLTLSSLQASTPFNLDDAQERSTSIQSPDEVEYTSKSISHFTYTARIPFHPKRLQTFLKSSRQEVIRGHGIFWTTSKPNQARVLDVAAGSWETSDGGQWWAAVPEEQRPNSESLREYLEAKWDSSFGDRRQEITLIGLSLDQEELTASLNDCLLTESELATLTL